MTAPISIDIGNRSYGDLRNGLNISKYGTTSHNSWEGPRSLPSFIRVTQPQTFLGIKIPSLSHLFHSTLTLLTLNSTSLLSLRKPTAIIKFSPPLLSPRTRNEPFISPHT